MTLEAVGGYDGGEMNDRLKALRNSFFAGLLVVVPVAASILILVQLFTWITNFLLPTGLQDKLLTPVYRVAALGLFVAVTTLVGWGMRLVLGRRVVAVAESLLGRVPLLNKVYAFIKEVSQTLLSGKQTMFQRVVLVPHPRPGMFAIGFVTGASSGELRAWTNAALLNVFIPSSPPTNGLLLLVPPELVIDLDMSVADGMKLVLSGGAVKLPAGEPVTPPVA